jgi:hypothetical protein
MTSWRRALPTSRRPALPAGAQARSASETEHPWVPDDPESGAPEHVPPATPPRSPSPALMPVVVSEWELAHGPAGDVKARPRTLSVPRAAVTVKDDDAPSRERVRRFVEAWRWLVAARSQIQSTGLSADESDRYLAGAGVLVRVVPPSATRRSGRR